MSFALTALSANLFAQSTIQLKHVQESAVLAPNATVFVTTVAESNTKVDFDIKNTSANTQYYNAKRYDVILNTGASAYFCFAGNCYGDQTFVSPTSITLTAGQSASEIPGSFNILTSDLDEGQVVGLSVVKYTFINTANASDSVQVTIKYNGTTVSVKEVAKTLSSFEIFPNPAKETASIRINSPKSVESTLSLFNSLGESVYQKVIAITEGKNKIDLNVENLPAGVYFASIKTGDSTISKKLIIN